MTCRPATSKRRIRFWGTNPSNTGTTCVTPSPVSTTQPVNNPCAYNVSMAWIETLQWPNPYNSNMAVTSFFLFARGFMGGSVSMIL